MRARANMLTWGSLAGMAVAALLAVLSLRNGNVFLWAVNAGLLAVCAGCFIVNMRILKRLATER